MTQPALLQPALAWSMSARSASASPGGLGFGTPVFVGRERELAGLAALLAEAAASRPAVVCLEGPPGVGKSALIAELLRRHPSVPVLAASGDAGEAALPFGLLSQLIGNHGQFPAGHGPLPASHGPVPASHGPVPASHGPVSASHGPVSASYGPVSASHGPVSASHGPVPASYGPVSASHGPVPASQLPNPPLPAGGPAWAGSGSLRPQTDPLQAGALLAGLIAGSAASAGLVMVVEDLHWADPQSVQALLFACRRLAGHRVLVLLTARPHALRRLGDGWARFLSAPRGGTGLQLAGLTEAELGQLAAALGRGHLPASALRRVAAASGGNPLLAEALLAELPDHVLLGPPGRMQLPGSVSSVILARLAALPAPARDLVTTAAVLTSLSPSVPTVTLTAGGPAPSLPAGPSAAPLGPAVTNPACPAVPSAPARLSAVPFGQARSGRAAAGAIAPDQTNRRTPASRRAIPPPDTHGAVGPGAGAAGPVSTSGPGSAAEYGAAGFADGIYRADAGYAGERIAAGDDADAGLVDLEGANEALEEAGAGGFLVRGGGGDEVSFGDELTRRAVYEDLPSSRRRALHRWAATVTTGAIALEHRAVAASGASPAEREALARELDAAAEKATSSGQPQTAAHQLTVAARLGDPGGQGGRLLTALELLLAGADTAGAASLREQVEALPQNIRRDAALGHLAFREARTSEAQARWRSALAPPPRPRLAAVQPWPGQSKPAHAERVHAELAQIGSAQFEAAQFEPTQPRSVQAGPGGSAAGTPASVEEAVADGVARREAAAGLALCAASAGDLAASRAWLAWAAESGRTQAGATQAARAFAAVGLGGSVQGGSGASGRMPTGAEGRGRRLAPDGSGCLRALAQAVAGDAAGGLAALPGGFGADGGPAALVLGSLTDELTVRGVLRLWGGDLDGADDDLSVAVSRLSAGARLRFPGLALSYLAETEFRLGRWDDAAGHAERAVAAAQRAAHLADLPLACAVAAQIAAVRGEADLAAAYARTAEETARTAGTLAAVLQAGTARVVCHLVQADPGPVLTITARMRRADGVEDATDPATGLWRPARIWALLRTGQTALAAAEAAALGRWARDHADEHALVHAARLRAAVALSQAGAGRADSEPAGQPPKGPRLSRQNPSGPDHGRRTLNRPEPDSPELGQPELSGRELAERLLAEAEPVAARLPLSLTRLWFEVERARSLGRGPTRPAALARLRAAHEALVRLGARPLADGTQADLAALGMRERPEPDGAFLGVSGLTNQERQVAALVAAGLSNREAAARLYLSRKTIEYHLARIFTKLGVQNRYQLAARFSPDAISPGAGRG